MILCGSEIRRLLNQTTVEYRDRLVITPILEPGSQIDDTSGSIDLRLGPFFSVLIRSEIPSLQLNPKEYNRLRDKSMRNLYVEVGDEFILHPRQFVLGHTIEWIHLPSNLAAYVVGRSVWGRHGLIIATAVGVHPMYSGVLTLELTNLGEVPIPLKPGLRYAQLFIHEAKGTAGHHVPRASYMGSTKPGIGQIDFREIELLEKLKSGAA